MTREEASAFMPWLPPVKHSMHRRASWHDYREPALYMVTMVIKDRRPLLGTLELQPHPRVIHSRLGAAICWNEMAKISAVYPMVNVWAKCIMPDHIHMILRVDAPLPGERHLGHVVAGFKGGCSRLWWSLTGLASATAQYKQQHPLFEDNYNDRLLYKPEQLYAWHRYLRDNPRRLALKRKHPQLFTTLHRYIVDGRSCSIFGNRFLLDIPDKEAVIVHRSDTPAEYEAKCRQWLACGERGGVLVSAAIGPPERAVMRIALERGYSLILLRENGFPELYKPSGEAFDACAQGRLLQIAPWEYHHDARRITRAQCLELNAMALSLART